MSSEPQLPGPHDDTDSKVEWCTCKGDDEATWSAHGGKTGQSSAKGHAIQQLHAELLLRPGCSCNSRLNVQAKCVCMCQGGTGPARAQLVGGEGRAQRGPGRAGRGRALQRLRAGAGVRAHQLAGRDRPSHASSLALTK